MRHISPCCCCCILRHSSEYLPVQSGSETLLLAMPAAGPDDGGRRPKRLQRFDAPGERARYFAYDDAPDLAQLVKRQRYEGAEDIDANLADNIARKAGFKCAPSSFCSGWRSMGGARGMAVGSSDAPHSACSNAAKKLCKALQAPGCCRDPPAGCQMQALSCKARF